MSDFKPEHLAKEAARLRADAVLIEAFKRAQLDALTKLVTVDADDKTAVLRLQAKVQAFDEILSELESMILAQPSDQNGEPSRTIA